MGDHNIFMKYKKGVEVIQRTQSLLLLLGTCLFIRYFSGFSYSPVSCSPDFWCVLNFLPLIMKNFAYFFFIFYFFF